MLRGIIFDHDGTLVDSEHKHYWLWADLLAPFGVNLGEAEYQQHLAGVPTDASARYLVAKYPLPLSAEELFAMRNRVAAATLNTACSLIPGAQTLVEFCARRKLKMAIATGAPMREVQPTLSEYRFDRYFTAVATRDHVVNAKPAGDVYQHALAGLKLSANEAIAVEDSPTGLASARAAGLDCIIVRNGYSSQHDFAGAVAIFDNMASAQHWLVREYQLP